MRCCLQAANSISNATALEIMYIIKYVVLSKPFIVRYFYFQFFHFFFQLFRYFTTAAIFCMSKVPFDSLLQRWIFWHRVGQVPFFIESIFFHTAKFTTINQIYNDVCQVGKWLRKPGGKEIFKKRADVNKAGKVFSTWFMCNFINP